MSTRKKTGVVTLEDINEQDRHVLEGTMAAMKNFQQEIENDVPKIPESVFRDQLLPILVDRRHPERVFSLWQDIAGHVSRQIEVVSDSDGESLFRVPALMRTIDKGYTAHGRNSVYEVVATAEQKASRHPAAGAAHITQNMTNRISHTPISREEVARWNSILKNYGYEPLFGRDIQSDENDTEQPSSGTDNLNIVGYDDI